MNEHHQILINKLLLIIGAATTGSVLPYAESPLRIPPIVMDVFQCIAWGSAGIIAIITVIKYLKNKK